MILSVQTLVKVHRSCISLKTACIVLGPTTLSLYVTFREAARSLALVRPPPVTQSESECDVTTLSVSHSSPVQLLLGGAGCGGKFLAGNVSFPDCGCHVII